MKSAAEDDS